MRKLIAVLILLLAIWGGWKLYLYWGTYRDSDPDLRHSGGGVARGPLGEMDATMDMQSSMAGGGSSAPYTPPISPARLEGMPSPLEPLLSLAQKQGANGLKQWLKDYGKMVKDPRLAWIQLDYVVLVAQKDLAEARRVFAEVKSRTPSASPVYSRVKSLEKTYEQ